MKPAVSHRVDEFWSQFNPLKCRKTREMKFKAFVYLFLFFSSFAEAKTYYVLVDGGASKNSNYYRYYNSVRRGYETAKNNGSSVVVLAKDGVWRTVPQNNESLSDFSLTSDGAKSVPKDGLPSYPPISGSAKSSNDLKTAITNLKLQPTDRLVVYMTGHGNSPEGYNPSTSTYEFYNNSESWDRLGNAFEGIPSGVKVKIATTSCFGGGLHHLSRKMNNICSTASSPFFATNSSGTFAESLFSEGFWNRLQQSKNSSFADLSLAGLKSDIANANLGSLSSFDYVDFTLKKGIYGKEYRDTDYSEPQTIAGREIWKKRDPTGADFNSVFPRKPINDSDIPIPSSLEGGICQNCCSSGVQSDLDKLTKLAQTLSEVTQQAVVQDLEKRADRQPAQVRTIFHDVIDDMKKNGASYLQTAKMYEDKYKDLVRRWNEHKEKFKNAGAITKWWQGEGEARAKIQKEFDTLKSNAERDLKQYSFNHQMLQRLERLDEFNKKATPEQKKKFVQLLQCEWEPL